MAKDIDIKDVNYNDDNKVVVKNNYIMAVHPDGMSLTAMKLFRLTIAQCRMNDTGFYVYKFRVGDLVKELQVSRQDVNRDIKTMCKQIMQMLLYCGDITGKDWEFKHIFEKCEYRANEESVYIQLHSDMTPLFLRIDKTGSFTRIPLISMLLMKSKYSIRLYELICYRIMSEWPYSNVSTTVVLPLEETKKYLVRSKGCYDSISNFKARILLPALAEIEKCSSWKIIRHDIKSGRTITAFKLEIWDADGYQIVQDCIARGVPIPRPKYFHGERQER